MNITPPDYSIIDGFVLNQNLRCSPTFLNLAVNEEFDRIRRSGSYRSKSWCVPKDPSVTVIPGRNSFEYELNMVPGSALWGFIFTVQNTGANPGPFSFQIRDACTGQPLFSETLRCDQFIGSPSQQQLFPKLLVVPTPGLLAIEICSLQAANATGVQLVLCGGEPVCPS